MEAVVVRLVAVWLVAVRVEPRRIIPVGVRVVGPLALVGATQVELDEVLAKQRQVELVGSEADEMLDLLVVQPRLDKRPVPDSEMVVFGSPFVSSAAARSRSRMSVSMSFFHCTSAKKPR